jgi:UDP-N-acetylmuramyl pentapeptide synthase
MVLVNRVFIDREGFLAICVCGEQTGESVREMGEKITAFGRQLRETGAPILIMDDLTAMGETTSEARKEVARLAKTLDFDRCAMLGNGTAVMRYGTNLMLRAIGKSNVRYFGNRSSARKWLRHGTLATSRRPTS